MEAMFTFIHKTIAMLIGFATSVALYFVPIRSLVELLSILFLVNVILGIVHSIRHNYEDLDKTKVFNGLKEFGIYVGILAGLFVIGDKMKASDFIYTVTSGVTWGLVYLYITNIFKNLSRFAPTSKGLRWIYYMFNLEFLKLNPKLKEFLDKDNTNEDNK